MSTVGRQLLSALVYSGDVQDYMKMALEPHLFKDSELVLFEYISNHLSKFGAIPKATTIEDVPALEDALVEAPEPPEFYLEGVEHRFLHNALKATVQEASLLLTTKQATPALDVIMKSVSTLYQKRQRKNLFDFRNAQDIIQEAYLAQKTMGNEVSMPFGWPHLDNMSGGMRPGDFVTFVGRPQAGKTFKLLYTAHNAWKTGRVPLFISMEMMTVIITQRLAAMHTKKKLTDLIKAELSTKAANAMMGDLHKLKKAEVPLWVVDGSLVRTVDDILMLCHQLNPSAVFVDGAYLLDHQDKRMGKWDKQADNARQLKQRIATDLGIPVVASYQLTKGSVKAKKAKGKGQDVADGMEDVYGSDEMAQLSTVMLGLFDNEEDIEAKKQRKIKILKGRNGETGEFLINWDFGAAMNFTEVAPPEDPKDVQMEFMG